LGKYGIAGQATGDNKLEARALHPGYLRQQTHSEYEYLLFFHCKYGYKNAPLFYVYIR